MSSVTNTYEYLEGNQKVTAAGQFLESDPSFGGRLDASPPPKKQLKQHCVAANASLAKTLQPFLLNQTAVARGRA
jgi:hypothetical protein